MRVACAPPGTQASVFNVDAAYQRMPIAPEDQWYVAISHDGNIHIDHDSSFGSANSPGVFSHVANAIAFIFRFNKIEDLIKWVDDFVFFRYPTVPSTTGPLGSQKTCSLRLRVQLYRVCVEPYHQNRSH
jgi:hypothetical protein